MGTFFSKFSKSKYKSIHLMGFSSSGKESILNHFKDYIIVNKSRTTGFYFDYIDYKGMHFTVYRNMPEYQYKPGHIKITSHDMDGLVFVIDSSDDIRIEDAIEELQKLLTYEELKKVVFLIMANKQDIKGVISPDQNKKMLTMELLQERKCLVQGCSAITGEGVKEGFDWMVNTFLNKKNIN